MSFDEMYDELVHAEFLTGAVNAPPRRGAHASLKATMSASRLRSIVLVTSGGLAFAALGSFLGGLGGEFAVTPAGAHALTTSERHMAFSAAPGATAFHAGARSVAPGGSGPVTAAASGLGASGGPASVPAISSSTGSSSASGPVSSTTNGVSGGSSGGSVSSTVGSSSSGSSTGGSGGTTTGSTSPAPTSPVTPIVGQLGLSGVSTDLTQTLNGVVGSVSVPGTDLGTVTDPLTGVVTGVTSGLLGG